jgi:hypothetical protein
MDREQLIAIAMKIAEIRAELTRMATLQEELRQLEDLLDSVATGKTLEGSTRRRRSGETIEDRVYKVIVDGADRDWNAEEIAGELGGIKVPTTRAAISKLRVANKIADTTRGRVRAKREREQSTEGDSTVEQIAA